MAAKPVRVQRRRAKGWKMPANTVYVGRPTKWGNPFEVGQHGTQASCVDLYRFLIGGYLAISNGPEQVKQQQVVMHYVNANIEKLKGKNLACFCLPSKPCHADVLLALANGWKLPALAAPRRIA